MYDDVHTFTRDGEREALIELAKDKNVLELGTWVGRSAMEMATTAKSVITIDTHEGDIHTGPADTRDMVNYNLDRYKIYNVIPVTGKNSVILPALESGRYKFDLIFIDASHDYRSVLEDSYLCWPLLAGNGLMAWHDYGQSGADTAPAVNEFVTDKNMRLYALVECLIVYQRQ